MKWKQVLRVASAAVVLTGLCILLWPRYTNWRYQTSVRQMKAALTAAISEDGERDLDYLELLRAMQEYNAQLEANGQAELVDASSYEVPSFDLAAWGVEDNIIGYIDIPAIDVTLPIYLGANTENMAAGAAQLSNTSLPIGSFQGVSTNCVIAGHRGYRKADMFRHLDELQVGDQVIITNLWETLTYEVVETKVIVPTDFDQVLIQDGRDLLTLSTCHPYRYNYQRYIVYCERVLDDGALATREDELAFLPTIQPKE